MTMPLNIIFSFFNFVINLLFTTEAFKSLNNLIKFLTLGLQLLSCHIGKLVLCKQVFLHVSYYVIIEILVVCISEHVLARCTKNLFQTKLLFIFMLLFLYINFLNLIFLNLRIWYEHFFYFLVKIFTFFLTYLLDFLCSLFSYFFKLRIYFELFIFTFSVHGLTRDSLLN